ncbi:MAG: hypothetical protein UT05_C0009G0006 [Parcubacteria group bacterium GW2011_GWF2_38_76]|nr:MAG: hypothetical protein UT05_C0009G0006 [Parcubacteria group bacterium GW2011_GWF2_38_76]
MGEPFRILHANKAVCLLRFVKTEKAPQGCVSVFTPRAGFEPATNRLTGDCSTAELSRNVLSPLSLRN